MTEQYDEIITSEEQAVRVKADLKLADAVPTKQWRHSTQLNTHLALVWVTLDPPQGPGEAVFSVRDDGTVEVFTYF